MRRWAQESGVRGPLDAVRDGCKDNKRTKMKKGKGQAAQRHGLS